MGPAWLPPAGAAAACAEAVFCRVPIGSLLLASGVGCCHTACAGWLTQVGLLACLPAPALPYLCQPTRRRPSRPFPAFPAPIYLFPPPPTCPAAVDAAIAEQQLDLTEAEFARLLQAAAAGGSWERAASVLRRVGSELTALQPGTLARVRALFASPAAGAERSGWQVGPTTVGPTGECSSCGGQLKALDLSAEEMRTFAEGIAAIAERQEKRPNDFQQVGGGWRGGRWGGATAGSACMLAPGLLPGADATNHVRRCHGGAQALLEHPWAQPFTCRCPSQAKGVRPPVVYRLHTLTAAAALPLLPAVQGVAGAARPLWRGHRRRQRRAVWPEL